MNITKNSLLLIIEKEKSFSPMSPDLMYNYSTGYWIGSDGIPLVKRKDSPRYGTKKEDVETGEDVKGS